jgi:hypothetical protein
MGSIIMLAIHEFTAHSSCFARLLRGAKGAELKFFFPFLLRGQKGKNNNPSGAFVI